MAFTLKTYRISFVWNGKELWEIVQAWAPHDAIRILQQRYPGSSSFSWREA